MINSSKPDLPDKETFTFNNLFLVTDSLNYSIKDYTQYNWILAASKFFEWNMLVGDNIKLSYSALQKAYLYEAMPFDTKTWYWEYDFSENDNNYTVFLYATSEIDSSLFWEMYLSVNESEKGLVLSGKNNKFFTQGQWLFYREKYSSNEILKIDWIKNDTALIVDFTNVYSNSIFKGSSLEIIYNYADTNFVSYIFTNARNLRKSYIELNTTVGSGKVKDFYVFGDSLWHCWDSNFVDIECE